MQERSNAQEGCTVVELDSIESSIQNGPIRLFHLSLGSVTVELCSLGASILKILLPPDNVDVVLGFGSIQEMIASKNPPYWGVVPGRVANRIRRGELRMETNGILHQLDINNPPNHLHGGIVGFSHRVWNAEVVGEAVRFSLTSLDGDQHYPGSVQVTATYSLHSTPGYQSVKLCLDLKAQLIGDIPTPVNLTQHSYFNLAGHDSEDGVLDHSLKLFCDAYTPVDSTSIPTRAVQSLDQDPVMDWRSRRTIRDALAEYGVNKVGLSSHQVRQDVENRGMKLSADSYGFDHNYVVRKESTDSLNLVAVLEHHKSRRRLTVRCTTPGVQLYTANYLDGTLPATRKPPYDEKHAGGYLRWQGVCLETQYFPDSVLVDANSHSDFAAGKCPILSTDNPNYEETIEYTFECMPRQDHAVPLASFRGTDSNNAEYSSVDQLWKELGWNEKDQSSWYKGAASYYEKNCSITIEGVLGGFASLTDIDLDGSLQFVRQLEHVRPSVRSWSRPNRSKYRACECGAGLGRVTKGLLLQSLGIEHCDLVESSSELLSAAPEYLGDGLAQKCRFFCTGLQCWEPKHNTYAVIWIQWVLSYLTDDDIVSFLRRCGTSLVEDGVIVLKENSCVECDFEVDLEDASVTRSSRYWQHLIKQAGLRVIHQTNQLGFPGDIYPVPILALEVDPSMV